MITCIRVSVSSRHGLLTVYKKTTSLATIDTYLYDSTYAYLSISLYLSLSFSLSLSLSLSLCFFLLVFPLLPCVVQGGFIPESVVEHRKTHFKVKHHEEVSVKTRLVFSM